MSSKLKTMTPKSNKQEISDSIGSASLKTEFNNLSLDNHIKDEIKSAENKIKLKISEEITSKSSFYDYFLKLLPPQDTQISKLVISITKKFYENIKNNKIKMADTPSNIASLISHNNKTQILEDHIIKKKIKDVNLMKSQLEKKLENVGMELDLLKAKDFSTPKEKPKKFSEEKFKEFDEFIKKTIFERKEIEKRRNDHIEKMMEAMRKQQEELKQMEKLKKEEQNKEKIEKMQKNIEEINRRMNNREDETKKWKETLKNLYKNAPKPVETFLKKQQEELQKTMNSELSKLKERAKPIDPIEIKSHMDKYNELKKKHQDDKKKEKKDFHYKKPDFQSEFYKQANSELEHKVHKLDEKKKLIEEKKKKIIDLETQRKEKYLPKISEEKREELEKNYEKIIHTKIKKLHKKKKNEVGTDNSGDELSDFDPLAPHEQNSQAKGLEYLDFVRKLKKKKKEISKGSKSVDNLIQNLESEGSVEKKKLPKDINYMKEVRNKLAKKNDFRVIENLINDNSLSDNLKRDQVKIQSEFWEEKAKMKEQARKIKKPKNEISKIDTLEGTEDLKDETDEINELYLNSVKAKLALFKEK